MQAGGAHTSRTMLLADLEATLAACPPSSLLDDYKRGVVDNNVAGKSTLSSRERTFRYLRELYGLDLDDSVFRAFRRLWTRDEKSRPTMALLMAIQRDAAFRATVPAVVPREVADPVTSDDLATAVEAQFPGAYSESIRAKIGRNALSSWQQAGYLVRSNRTTVVRGAVRPDPGAVAMALVIAAQEGRAGERLFDSWIVGVLDASSTVLHDRAYDCSRKGWLEYRSRGAITEIGLDALSAPAKDLRLPLSVTGGGA